MAASPYQPMLVLVAVLVPRAERVGLSRHRWVVRLRGVSEKQFDAGSRAGCDPAAFAALLPRVIDDHQGGQSLGPRSRQDPRMAIRRDHFVTPLRPRCRSHTPQLLRGLR